MVAPSLLAPIDRPDTHACGAVGVWCDVHVCVSVCGDASIDGAAAAAAVVVSQGDRKLLNSQACRVA